MDFPLRIGSTAPSPNLNRRGLLRLSALAALSPAVLSCSGPEPDPLVKLSERARTDTELARLTAERHPELAARARAVADARARHGETLRREITRVAGEDSTFPSGSAPEPEIAETPEGAAERLRTALREAQRQAAETAPELSGYRAGLAGSVSAGCASLVEVVA
ncbi:hypothetical protein [Actinopolyspora xinjiangensis]|uniref:hypothetical protein n=1 Tax=Actinopolyspora xinjiangensis TaxID=405564 RepID=UPI0011137460|nr:hypothetical protein [Actinopolyspora xinjiangensis]